MTHMKKQFLEKLSQTSGYSKRVCKEMLDALILVLCDVLVNGDTIKLHGLFEIGVRQRKGWDVPHPISGDKVHVDPMTLPYFRFGRTFLDAANGTIRNQAKSVEITCLETEDKKDE